MTRDELRKLADYYRSGDEQRASIDAKRIVAHCKNAASLGWYFCQWEVEENDEQTTYSHYYQNLIELLKKELPGVEIRRIGNYCLSFHWS